MAIDAVLVNGMKIVVRIQRHLAVAHSAEDSGDWVFTLCRRGFEKLIGRRLRTGDEVKVEIEAKDIET